MEMDEEKGYWLEKESVRERKGENGKFTSYIGRVGKPPNIPFFDSARRRHARFVLKSFYNSVGERGAATVLSFARSLHASLSFSFSLRLFLSIRGTT